MVNPFDDWSLKKGSLAVFETRSPGDYYTTFDIIVRWHALEENIVIHFKNIHSR